MKRRHIRETNAVGCRVSFWIVRKLPTCHQHSVQQSLLKTWPPSILCRSQETMVTILLNCKWHLSSNICYKSTTIHRSREHQQTPEANHTLTREPASPVSDSDHILNYQCVISLIECSRISIHIQFSRHSAATGRTSRPDIGLDRPRSYANDSANW